MNVARDLNRRTPLIEGVFPKADRNSTVFTFQDEYRRAIAGFSNTLLASGAPTAAEVAEEQANVQDLMAMEAELKGDKEPTAIDPLTQPGGRQAGTRGQPIAPPVAPLRGGAPMIMNEGGMRGMGGGGRGMGGGMPMMPQAQMYNNSPTDEPKYNPMLRAQVSKAKSIRCYADMNSFHVSPIVESGEAPPPEELWAAQVGLWIQRDVVQAIADMNNQAALKVKDGEAFVQQMPVKRIAGMQVFGYRLKGGELLPFAMWSAESRGSTPLEQPLSFTGREPDDQFDVIQFSVAVYVDQRDLLKLIDHIGRKNFYNCIDVQYRQLTPADTAEGYMYGTDPVVRAELAFEGYMARSVFAPMMPKTIRDILGIQKDGG
jgi:hypothetical protein